MQLLDETFFLDDQAGIINMARIHLWEKCTIFMHTSFMHTKHIPKILKRLPIKNRIGKERIYFIGNITLIKRSEKRIDTGPKNNEERKASHFPNRHGDLYHGPG